MSSISISKFPINIPKNLNSQEFLTIKRAIDSVTALNVNQKGNDILLELKGHPDIKNQQILSNFFLKKLDQIDSQTEDFNVQATLSKIRDSLFLLLNKSGTTTQSYSWAIDLDDSKSDSEGQAYEVTKGIPNSSSDDEGVQLIPATSLEKGLIPSEDKLVYNRIKDLFKEYLPENETVFNGIIEFIKLIDSGIESPISFNRIELKEAVIHRVTDTDPHGHLHPFSDEDYLAIMNPINRVNNCPITRGALQGFARFFDYYLDQDSLDLSEDIKEIIKNKLCDILEIPEELRRLPVVVVNRVNENQPLIGNNQEHRVSSILVNEDRFSFQSIIEKITGSIIFTLGTFFFLTREMGHDSDIQEKLSELDEQYKNISDLVLPLIAQDKLNYKEDLKNIETRFNKLISLTTVLRDLFANNHRDALWINKNVHLTYVEKLARNSTFDPTFLPLANITSLAFCAPAKLYYEGQAIDGSNFTLFNESMPFMISQFDSGPMGPIDFRTTALNVSITPFSLERHWGDSLIGDKSHIFHNFAFPMFYLCSLFFSKQMLSYVHPRRPNSFVRPLMALGVTLGGIALFGVFENQYYLNHVHSDKNLFLGNIKASEQIIDAHSFFSITEGFRQWAVAIKPQLDPIFNQFEHQNVYPGLECSVVDKSINGTLSFPRQEYLLLNSYEVNFWKKFKFQLTPPPFLEKRQDAYLALKSAVDMVEIPSDLSLSSRIFKK